MNNGSFSQFGSAEVTESQFSMLDVGCETCLYQELKVDLIMAEGGLSWDLWCWLAGLDPRAQMWKSDASFLIVSRSMSL